MGESYANAQEFLELAGRSETGSEEEHWYLGAAQVHALLALVDAVDDLRTEMQDARLTAAPSAPSSAG